MVLRRGKGGGNGDGGESQLLPYEMIAKELIQHGEEGLSPTLWGVFSVN